MHYYKFHIGDYARDTSHLSVVEHGIYRLLLDWCYLNEKPISTERAMRVGRGYPEETQSVLSEFFSQTDNGWVHTRVVEEIRAYHYKAEQNAKNGAKGGRKKSEKNPVATQTVSETNPNHKPLTTNHEYSVPNGTVGKPTLTPDEIIFTYGVPLLTNAGTADKQARSFLGGLRKSHGDDALIDALRECLKAKPLQPLEWLARVLPPKGAPPKRNRQEQLEDANAAVAQRFIEKLKAEDEPR